MCSPGFFIFNNLIMQNVILNLRNELIRSVSAIDAWFDKDGSWLRRNINATETVAVFLCNLVSTSRNLLDAITHKSSGSLSGPVDLQFPQDSLDTVREFNDIDHEGLSVARAELREQLDRCLIYLEWLHQKHGHSNSGGRENVEHFGGYQGVYLLLIHLQRYMGDLRNLEGKHQVH